MYLESIKFKRSENSQWEEGYYIGDCENSDNSTILDNLYKPVQDKSIYDVRVNAEKRIKLLIEEDID